MLADPPSSGKQGPLAPLGEQDLREIGRTIDLLRTVPTRQNAAMARVLARLVVEIRVLWRDRDVAVAEIKQLKHDIETLEQQVESLREVERSHEPRAN